MRLELGTNSTSDPSVAPRQVRRLVLEGSFQAALDRVLQLDPHFSSNSPEASNWNWQHTAPPRGATRPLTRADRPSFPPRRPQALFRLRACEFGAKLASGDLPAAMALLRSDGGLSALAQRSPALLDDLKALSVLAVTGAAGGGSGGAGGDSGGPVPSAAEAAETVCSELLAALGQPEPRLTSLLRGLLGAHRAWFRVRQGASSDSSDLRPRAFAPP